MPTSAEDSISGLVASLRRGSSAAADEAVRAMLPRLIGLARRMLAGRPQRFADAEDAVQSALLSFWRRAEAGRLDERLEAGGLWGLLAVMTTRKARRHLRRERAEKRGGGKVRGGVGGPVDSQADASGDWWSDALAVVPAAEFDLLCEERLKSLEDELRQFALYRLLGYSTAEIAAMLGCTQRKVQRKIELVRLQWERETTEEG